jgi:hypothetical protein
LARKPGVVTSTVFVVERGSQPTKSTTVEKLAKAQGVSVAMLTGEKRLRVTTEPIRNGKVQRGRSAKS